MKSTLRLIASLLFCLWSLVSCKSKIPVDNSWILGSNCGNNCWREIRLGVSQLDQTLDVISSDPDIFSESIQTVETPWKIYSSQAEFLFDDTTIRGNFFFINGLASHIKFRNVDKSINDGLLGITIDDIIKRFGPPAYLFRNSTFSSLAPSPDSVHWFVYLINPTTGYAITYDEDILSKELDGIVSPEIELYEIVLFSPSNFQQLMENEFLQVFINNEYLEDAQQWDGYGEYPRK